MGNRARGAIGQPAQLVWPDDGVFLCPGHIFLLDLPVCRGPTLQQDLRIQLATALSGCEPAAPALPSMDWGGARRTPVVLG